MGYKGICFIDICKNKSAKRTFRIGIFLDKTPIENMDNRISSLRFSVVSLFPMEQDLVVDAVEDVIKDVLRRGSFFSCS